MSARTEGMILGDIAHEYVKLVGFFVCDQYSRSAGSLPGSNRLAHGDEESNVQK